MDFILIQGNGMDSSRGIMSRTMDRFKMVHDLSLFEFVMFRECFCSLPTFYREKENEEIERAFASSALTLLFQKVK